MNKLVLTAAVLLLLAACSGTVPHTMHKVQLDQGQSHVVGLDAEGAHEPEVNGITLELFAWTDRELAEYKPPTEPRPPAVNLVARHYVRLGDDWTTIKQVNVAKLSGEERVQEFRYLIVNLGRKPFQGDLAIQGNPGPDLRFLGTSAVAKVKDQRELKEAMAFLPAVGMLAMALDNFAVLGHPAYTVDEEDGTYKYVIKDLCLESYEGVLIEYKAELAIK